MTSVLIALFIATQAPTNKNCAKLSTEMLKMAQRDAESRPVHLQSDIDDIRMFVRDTCKDGYKHK
jgi:hypothetical protein